MQVALSGPSVTDCCCSIMLFSAQCTLALGGLRSAMESWEAVGGRKKTTKIAGQGHRPSPWGDCWAARTANKMYDPEAKSLTAARSDMVAEVSHLF